MKKDIGMACQNVWEQDRDDSDGALYTPYKVRVAFPKPVHTI